MVFKRLIWISFLFMIIEGCGQDHRYVVNYIEAKKHFKQDQVSHLPVRIPLISSFILSEDRITSHPGIWVKAEYSKDIIDSVHKVVLKKSIAQYYANDTCLMLIDKHLNSQNWINFEKDQRNPPENVKDYSECVKGKLPLPKFWENGWSETKSNPINLESEYELFVLEAKSGIYLDVAKLPNGKYTPEGWQHGYSKGIAINRKTLTIIFWFDIW